MSLERGGRTNEANEKNDRKKMSIQSSENLETWKPEPGDVHVRRSTHPPQHHPGGARNPPRPRKREHGGFAAERDGRNKKRNRKEKEEGGRGGGRFPTPLNFRLCFAQRGAGSSRSSAGDPQALFPCRRLESRVCSPPEAILPANAFLFSPFWSQVAD